MDDYRKIREQTVRFFFPLIYFSFSFLKSLNILSFALSLKLTPPAIRLLIN